MASPGFAERSGTTRERPARDRTATVLDAAHEAFISIGVDGRVGLWNSEAERLFGWSREEAIGCPLHELIIPREFHQAHKDGIRRFLQTGIGRVVNQRLELTARRRDGMEFPVEMTISAVHIAGQWAFNAFLHDITERKRAEQYREAQLALSGVLANASGLDDAAVALLQTLGETMGWELGVLWELAEGGERLACSALWELRPSDDSEFVRATREIKFERGVGLPGRVWALDQPASLDDVQKDDNFPRIAAAHREGLHGAIGFPVSCGGQFAAAVEFFGHSIRPPDRQLFAALDGFRTQIGQFLERARAEALLAHQVVHDPLTGLPNRTLLLDRLEHGLGRLARSSSSLAVLFCDIDDFKAVNDSLGHALGDELLIAIADRLRASLRPDDTAARFGGDEFVVVCEDLTSNEQAAEIGQRLIDAFTDPFVLEDRVVHSSVSIGIAVTAADATSADAIIRDADSAVYRAKAHGGGRYELSNTTVGRDAVNRLQAKDALRHAITAGELVLLYQPQVSLETGRLVGVEGLVRWDHPTRGMLPPNEFIPLAETTGLIVPLGEWVLREACIQARRWQMAHPCRRPLAVAVNVSARQFREDDLSAMVAGVLGETGVDPGAIWFELTETSFMEDLERGVLGLQQLRALGTHVAIDDFGAGFSSLEYLKRLTAVETLKVDRSFTKNMLVDRRDHAIIEALLSLARALELNVVVEGVETPEQAGELRALGCRYAQGYLFARPGSVAAVDELLRTDGVVGGHQSEPGSGRLLDPAA